MRSSTSAKPRGFYVPTEHAQHYAGLGYEVVDDLRPNEVLVIPRAHESASKAEAGDGP